VDVSQRVRVVLFSGGRGSQALCESLAAKPGVDLTLAINGYDDGKSTGEVRRFLGDCLGPSDFRKNASTLARTLRCCPAALVALLDTRLPERCGPDEAKQVLAQLGPAAPEPRGEAAQAVAALLGSLSSAVRARLAALLDRFEACRQETGRPFSYHDCAIGNLVFAGAFLERDRRFNAAIETYTALLGVPSGMLQNVTDGTNAYLVALNRDGRLLASEAEIVDATRRNHIHEIYLVDRSPAEEPPEVAGSGARAMLPWLEARAKEIRPNRELLRRIAAADLIVYAPGTQHSSLLPSYMTPGLSAAIARNVGAVKLLVTNLQEDAEIPDASAVELTERALYYLREKGNRALPAPCLITHTLLNDPAKAEPDVPYVPLGRLQSIEDPRLVRIANYEDGGSGRHNAQKVLAPFIDGLAGRWPLPRVAVLLLDTTSLDKVAQTLLEAYRGGLPTLRAEASFFHACEGSLDPGIVEALGFPVLGVRRPGERAEESLLCAARDERFDYVLLFESSGMYRGEDIVSLIGLLASGRLDAVWGSRRLSVRDIRESYRFRYRKRPGLGALSYLGSYALSLAHLFLFGHYVADTLSGARVLRSRYLREAGIDLADKALNQLLLAQVFREGGELFETPVQFFSLSPERANRTTVLDGLRALVAVLRRRFHPG